jgi:hypothetical protein
MQLAACLGDATQHRAGGFASENRVQPALPGSKNRRFRCFRSLAAGTVVAGVAPSPSGWSLLTVCRVNSPLQRRRGGASRPLRMRAVAKGSLYIERVYILKSRPNVPPKNLLILGVNFRNQHRLDERQYTKLDL